MSVKSKILVINGSAREESNTTRLVNHLLTDGAKTIQLSEMDIAHYDYQQNYNLADDFQIIADLMIKADVIILATPVYWFTMSSYMKVFLDRWTDLISTHKSKGRALNGKKLGLLSQGSCPAPPHGFDTPFELTAAYMDMQFLGNIFWDSRSPLDNEGQKQIQEWIA